MISDPLTNMTSPTVTDTIGAFNTIFSGWFVFAILLSFVIALGLAVFSVNRNAVESFLFSFFVGTVSSFMLTFTRTTDGTPLVSFAQFTFLLIVTALLFIVNKVTD